MSLTRDTAYLVASSKLMIDELLYNDELCPVLSINNIDRKDILEVQKILNNVITCNHLSYGSVRDDLPEIYKTNNWYETLDTLKIIKDYILKIDENCLTNEKDKMLDILTIKCNVDF